MRFVRPWLLKLETKFKFSRYYLFPSNHISQSLMSIQTVKKSTQNSISLYKAGMPYIRVQKYLFSAYIQEIRLHFVHRSLGLWNVAR